jgi:uncharacterized damage-inducible protein DinB
MTLNNAIRQQLAAVLSWKDAHVTFEAAVAGLPPEARSARPAGVPYSAWQLVEHVRIAQHDILDFCRNAAYEEMAWPDDYWPASPEPPDAGAWEASLRAYAEDRAALERLALNPELDLTSTIPHGTGQTYLRELLLVADHTAYHVGELIVVRRLLGTWA